MAAKKTGKKMTKHVDREPSAYNGPNKVDFSGFASLLVDLPPGALKGLRRAGPNIDAVAAELAANMATAGVAAGIGQALYDSFVKHHGNVTQLAPQAAVLFKLAEVVRESMGLEEDAREQALSKIVDIIKSAAKRDKNESVKAPFQATLAYKGQAAQKGNRTKAAKKAAATPAATPAAGH